MSKTGHRLYVAFFFLIGILVIYLLSQKGYSYYSLPLAERPLDETNHELLKSGGVVGHGYGIIGTLMIIVGVLVYMLRKRSSKYFSFGVLKYWLELHIFLCTVGPILVLFHTAFKFGGIVAISFWSMVIVVLSGFVGRYLYLQIPRTISGSEMSINEIEDLDAQLSKRLENEFNLDKETLSHLLIIQSEAINSIKSGQKGWKTLVNGFLIRHAKLRSVRKELKHIKGLNIKMKIEIVSLIKSKIVLSQRIRLLKVMHRFFHYWHVFHLPFAISMFAIMLIHVAIAITFGAHWIF